MTDLSSYSKLEMADERNGKAPNSDGSNAEGTHSEVAFSRQVTAIIPTYNRAKFITTALETVLNQREPVFQVIVVDDGSTDDTAVLLRQYEGRIEYIYKENGGKSSAINIALQHAQGEWIWLFDDDDLALPDATKSLLDALEADRGADAAIGGRTMVRAEPDGSLFPVVKDYSTLEAYRNPSTSAGDGLFFNVLLGFSFNLQGMLIRRSALAAIDGLDERYLRGQDYEVIVRLLQRFHAVVLDRPVFQLRIHDGERGPTALRHSARERPFQWLKFDSMIGRQVRASVQLGDFLVPRVAQQSLSASQEARAMFNRAAVMATKGLFREFVEDLADSLARRPKGDLLCAEERELLFRLGAHPTVIAGLLADEGGIMDGLSSLPNRRATREAIACLARALLFECRRNLRKRQYDSGPLFGRFFRLATAARPFALILSYLRPRASGR